MLKEAIKSIKDDFSRSLFYWLTFVLTSMFMFLFFNISYLDLVGVTFIDSQSHDMATLTSVLVIAVCMIVIFFANNFYVRKKSKELAVRMVCGATYMQIAQYLLYQTGIIFLLSIPIGIILALIFIPVINYILFFFLNSNVQLYIQTKAIISTTIIIAFEIFWCTILNLGYSYRNSIRSLMIDDEANQKMTFHLPYHISHKVKKWMSIIMFIAPVVIFYLNGDQSGSMLYFSVIGMIGLYMGIDSVLVPLFDYWIQEKYADCPERVIYLGLLRNDFKMMKSNIILLITSAILLVSILIASIQKPVEVMLALLSFVVMNILLSLAVMFKFSTEIVSRKKVCASIERMGYMQKDQKNIILKEVIGLYGLIWFLSLSYIGNIFVVLMIHHLLHIYLIMGMLIAFLLPLIICGIMSYVYYYKVIFKEG